MKYRVLFTETAWNGGVFEPFQKNFPDIESEEILSWDMKKFRTYEEAVEYFLPKIRINGYDFFEFIDYGELKIINEKSKKFEKEFACHIAMSSEIGVRDCVLIFSNMEEVDKFKTEYEGTLGHIFNC